MPKPPKVVPIQEKKYQLIAKDTKAKRITLGIGGERIAIKKLGLRVKSFRRDDERIYLIRG
jgi:hypothetical protein